MISGLRASDARATFASARAVLCHLSFIYIHSLFKILTLNEVSVPRRTTRSLQIQLMDLRGVFAACHVTRHKQTHSAKCNDTSKRRFQKKDPNPEIRLCTSRISMCQLGTAPPQVSVRPQAFDVPRTCCGIQDRREKKNTSDSNDS